MTIIPCPAHSALSQYTKSNALTGDCRKFKTSTLTRHADSNDHKEAVAAESVATCSSFEKTVKNDLLTPPQGPRVCVRTVHLLSWCSVHNSL